MKFGLLTSILILLGLFYCVTSSIMPQPTFKYCDQWNLCSSLDHQYINKKCVPLKCSTNQNCANQFQCEEGICVPLKHAQDLGRYCDDWTPCLQSDQCIGFRCVPLLCHKDTHCLEDFTCFNNECVSNSYTGTITGHCDGWSPCPLNRQCVNRKCTPFICRRTPDCAQGYQCYEGNCIQINNSHGMGRYCDQQNQCDILHKCLNKVCEWK